MRLSRTVVEIWRLKDESHDLDLLGSRDVIGHVTIRLSEVDFLWVVHCEHASILHRYGNIAPQMLDARREREKRERERGRKMVKGKGKGKGEVKGKEKERRREKGKGKER